MRHRRYSFINVGLLLSAFWLAAGCSTIDDDLSDCGNTFEMDYELRLVTNMTTELKTKLTTLSELSVANALTMHLKDIFTDFAHDVDLSFYDTEGNLGRLRPVVLRHRRQSGTPAARPAHHGCQPVELYPDAAHAQIHAPGNSQHCR